MRIERAWAELQRAADVAAARGSLLFHLDLAAELARRGFAGDGIDDTRLAPMAEEDGYRVLALAAGPGDRLLGEARFDDAGQMFVVAAPDRTPPRALAVAAARATILSAFAADGGDAAIAYAAIVVPARESRRPLEGYALSIADDPGIVHPGGHWLLTLDPEGHRITARTPLSASTDSSPVPAGALRMAMLAEGGAVPNELHTYLSLKHGMPLSIRTAGSGVSWRVDGERTVALQPQDRR